MDDLNNQQELFMELEHSLEEQLLEAVNEQLKNQTMTKSEVMKLGKTVVHELRNASNVASLHVAINRIRNDHPQLKEDLKPLEDMLTIRLVDQLKAKIDTIVKNQKLLQLYQLVELD